MAEPSRCHPGHPTSSQPFAFRLGLPALPCCRSERPAGGGRGGLLVLSPPAPPSRSRDPCPTPRWPPWLPPGARPCQNTSPVPEPKAVGAAAPQCLTVSVVQDGDWGHRGLGAGSCEGLGAWWGMVGGTRGHGCLCHGSIVGLERGCTVVSVGLITPRKLGQGTSRTWSAPPCLLLPPLPAVPAPGGALHLHPWSPQLRVKPCPQAHGVPAALWGTDPALGGPLMGGHRPCSPWV